MISFKTRTITEDKWITRTWTFTDENELLTLRQNNEPLLPKDNDHIWDLNIDGEAIHPEEHREEIGGDEFWFEDLFDFDENFFPVTLNKTFFQVLPASPKKIEIKLGDGNVLIAEADGDPDCPAIYIGIENTTDKKKLFYQDLAVVREACRDAERTSPEHGKYEVLIFADCNSEDYTHKFTVEQYIVEEEE